MPQWVFTFIFAQLTMNFMFMVMIGGLMWRVHDLEKKVKSLEEPEVKTE